MKKNTPQSGFSLLEMVMAAAITVGLTAVIFQFLKTGQESAAVESTKSDLNQNFRAALDLVSRDLQSAGAGMPRFLGPILGKNGGVDGTGNQLPDRVMIVYGKSANSPAIVNSNVTSATPTIDALDDAAPTAYNVNDFYIVYTPIDPLRITDADYSDFAEFEIFKLTEKATIAGGTKLTPRFTNIAPDTAAFSPSNWVNWSSMVSEPSASVLRIVPLDEVIEYQVVKATNTLQRRKNQDTWVDVARGISDLQIQYRMEVKNTTGASVTYDSLLVDEPQKSIGNNRALIRGIIVTLNGTTEMKKVYDGQGQHKISQTVEIAPRNLVLTGLVPNR